MSNTSLGAASALVGNVAKLKNSKLYQKFMKNKDVAPSTTQATVVSPQASLNPVAGKIVKKPQP